MDPILSTVQQNLDSALSDPFISSSVLLGLAFYAYKAAPELPSFMEEHLQQIFFQIFIGFMVLYMSTQNFMLSLVVSIVFIYGMKMLSGVKEGMFGGGDCPDYAIGVIQHFFKGKDSVSVADVKYLHDTRSDDVMTFIMNNYPNDAYTVAMKHESGQHPPDEQIEACIKAAGKRLS